MSSMRSARTVRSLTLFNTLLMTTAFTVPAFAQIETVVVTAERKAEDIQTVPVAVTAITSKDLKAKQITNYRDLQFHVPSVTQTKSNFGGAQFQIRGITTQFGLGAAISQNVDDIYLEAPALVTGEFYDVDRVEVARGPQSTSYGRAATGGSVNIITSKPDLDNFAARVSLDYGSFNTFKPDAMVNVPVIDGELAVRLAVHADFHEGYEKNIYSQAGFPQIFPGTPPKTDGNSLGVTSARFSVRWEPSSDTTIDLVADGSYENDRRVRGDKQECHRDPSGVVGCLPDRLGFDAPNINSTFGVTLGSAQGIADALRGALSAGFGAALGSAMANYIGNTTGLCTLSGNGASGDPLNPTPGVSNPTFGALFNGYRATGPISSGGIQVPQTPEEVDGPCSGAGALVSKDILTTNTAYNPKYKTAGQLYAINWKQTITDWLSATVDLGYDSGYQFTQQDYTDATHENISAQITQAVTGFNTVFTGMNAFGPNPLYNAAAFFTNLTFLRNAAAYNTAYFNVPGSLPLSNTNYLGPRFGNYGGIIDNTRGGVLLKSPYLLAYDEDWFGQKEVTGEARFQTNFKGPLNFSAGAFFMSFESHNQYWVAFTGGDWDSAVLGAFSTPCAFPCLVAPATALMLGMPDFDAEYRRGLVQSRSAFLEGTYEVIPDELKVIAGARFNDDRSHLLRTPVAVGGGVLTTGLFPIGDPGVQLPVNQPSPFIATGKNNETTDLWTGRVSVNWTPKLSFTEQTFVYFTASRGELAGGVNVSNNGGAPIGGVTTNFKPATVDALELGTKNTLLDNTLTANLTLWYYNYENYQVGIIDNRQALTINIPARLYGFEGEFVWQPTEALAFNATISLTQSEAGHSFLVDQRNPTGNVANTILIKDLDNGSICTVQAIPGGPRTAGQTPADSDLTYHVTGFYLPNGGDPTQDAAFGIPLVNYGLCAPANGTASDAGRQQAQAALLASGFQYTVDVNPRTNQPVQGVCLLGTGTGGPDPAQPFDGSTTGTGGACLAGDFDVPAAGTGRAVDLHGNNLPQVPFGQVGLGAQYTFKFNGEYTLVPRVDYYWQSSMQSRVWNDPIIDRISAWDVMNVQVQLNAPDNAWYAQLFAKNIFDKHNPTGVYLTDPTSALFTNTFSEDPRVFGFSVGTRW